MKAGLNFLQGAQGCTFPKSARRPFERPSNERRSFTLSTYTRDLLGWHPVYPTLLEDLATGDYFSPEAMSGFDKVTRYSSPEMSVTRSRWPPEVPRSSRCITSAFVGTNPLHHEQGPDHQTTVPPTNRESKLNWIQTSTHHLETVVLIHAVGHDLTYWDRQIEVLSASYNVVAFDLPGHGRSTGSAADWSFAYAAEIVAELIREVSPTPVHLVGISFGGMIAQVTALTRPELILSLTLIGTAPSFPEEMRAGMRARAELVRAQGMAAVIESSLQRWFTQETRAGRPDITDRLTKTLLGDDAATHAAIWDIISGLDLDDRLHEILCPTLVLVGELDPSTTPAVARRLAGAIKRSSLIVVPKASHIVTVEAPSAVNTALLGFLAAYARES